MNQRAVVGAGLVASVVLNGALSELTHTPTLLGATPAGIVVYLAVGIGLPQFVIYRGTGGSVAGGLGVLSVALSVLVLVAGVAGDGLFSDTGGGFLTVLLLAVTGMVLGVVVREFARGYTG